MVVPHIELKQYKTNQSFDTLALFQEFGFNPFRFSQHIEWKGLFASQFEELYKNGLGIILGDTRNFCYVCSFRDGSSDSFNMTDFYTPEFRRYRNRDEVKPESIDALCRRLSQEMTDECGIRRVDFDINTNLVDAISYRATCRKVYDNQGSVVVNGSIPQVDIERRYFD